MKERIVGAAVLVLVVVLVVPVFLDGPPDKGEITSEQVPLPGQSDTENKVVVLERDRSEPVPANDGKASPAAAESRPAATTTQPQPQPVPARVEPTATEAQVETVVNESQTGMWAVQLGSFSSPDNAERLAAELRSQGHAAFLSQVATDDGQRHRVRIGPQKDRDAAEAVAAQLESAGHDVKVLPHP